MKINNIELNLTPEQVLEIVQRHQAEQEPKQIELEGGTFWLNSEGRIGISSSTSDTRNFGTEFKTEELAERAAKEIRRSNRLRALAWQICEPQDSDDCHIFKHVSETHESAYIASNCGAYDTSNISTTSGLILMSRDTATKICQLLNDGLFSLDGE